MDKIIEEICRKVHNKNAILFTGAGFSLDAINLLNEHLPSAKTMNQEICQILNVDEDDLSFNECCRRYINDIGKSKFCEFVKDKFQVKETSPCQNSYLSHQWRSIYTVNYDNVIETALVKNSKKYQSYTNKYSGDIDSGYSLVKVVHLNGYIENLTNPEDVEMELKTTCFSYDSNTMFDTFWFNQLKVDLTHCSGVVFVGFSGNKDDRKVFEKIVISGIKKEQVYFILPEPSQIVKDQLARYGTVVNLSSQQLITKIDDFKLSDEEKKLKNINYLSKVKSIQNNLASCPSGKDIFDFFTKNIIPEINSSSVYYENIFVKREQCAKIVEDIENHNVNIFVIISNIANGKTTLLGQVTMDLVSRDYLVYTLFERNISSYKKVKSDIELLLESNEKVVITFENYPTWIKLFKDLKNKIKHNHKFVVTAKLAANDFFEKELKKSGIQYLKYNIDKLTLNEKEQFIKVFMNAGLLGDNAKYSLSILVNSIYKDSNEIHSLFIEIIKSDVVLDSIRTAYNYLSPSEKNCLISMFILEFLNKGISRNILVDIWGYEFIAIVDNPENSLGFLDFIKNTFKDDSFVVRSTIMSYVILKEIAPYNVVLKVIKVLIDYFMDNISDKYIFTLLIEILRFSFFDRVFKERDEDEKQKAYKECLEIYDQCYSSNNTRIVNAHFWLQYAIACMAVQDYDRADKYFSTARSLATKQIVGDSSQMIDNHYARFLIESSNKALAKNNIEKAYRNFKRARSTIQAQFLDSPTYHTFRPLTFLPDFYDKFGEELRKNSSRFEQFYSFVDKACIEIKKNIDIIKSDYSTHNLDVIFENLSHKIDRFRYSDESSS